MKFNYLFFTFVIWLIAPEAWAQTGCTGKNCLENPLRFPSIERFVEGVLQAIILVAMPIIVAFMVYAGFKFIMARGNSSQITNAKENFKWVVIGTIMILGAWVLATLIGGTIAQLLGR